jgi:hypothetical protein
MAEWKESKRLKLKKHNRWQAKPGNHIFVSNKGAVRFEYPAKWIVLPGQNGSICFYDREPPDHHAILQVNHWELLPNESGPLPMAVDWTGLPLLELFVHSTSNVPDENRELKEERPVREVIRPGLEAIWSERLVFDLHDRKDVISRVCLARGANVTTLISYDFFADQHARFHPIWENVFNTLVLGQYVTDPTTGF